MTSIEELSRFCSDLNDPSFSWADGHPVSFLLKQHLRSGLKEGLRGEYLPEVLKVILDADTLLFSNPQYLDTAKYVLNRAPRIQQVFRSDPRAVYEVTQRDNLGNSALTVQLDDENCLRCVHHKEVDELDVGERFFIHTSKPFLDFDKPNHLRIIEGVTSDHLYNIEEGVRRMELEMYLLERVLAIGTFSTLVPKYLSNLGFEVFNDVYEVNESKVVNFFGEWKELRDRGERMQAVLMRLASNFLASQRGRLITSNQVVEYVNREISRHIEFYPYNDFELDELPYLDVNSAAAMLFRSGTGNSGLKCGNVVSGPRSSIKFSPMDEIVYPCHLAQEDCFLTGACRMNDGIYARDKQRKEFTEIVGRLTDGAHQFKETVGGDIEGWGEVFLVT